jgi:hypothetical protein
MAESLNGKQINNSAVNDDMIKDALKSGLSSINASDCLVNKTLLKCRDEIEKGKQEKKSKLFIPWIFRLGTPLAAGALVLVLLFNTNKLGMKGSSSPDMAPQASSSDTMSLGGMVNESKLMEAPVPSPEEARPAEPQEAIDDRVELFKEDIDDGVGPDQKDIDGGAGSDERGIGKSGEEVKPAEEGLIIGYTKSAETTESTEISELHSSAKREPGIRETSLTELEQPFIEIVNLYNQANETELMLKEGTILRITCLIKEGVSAKMLIDANDFNEILSDDGYWALPLINENGDIEKILTVCAYDPGNPEAVSSLDIIYTINRKKYIVSEVSVGDNIGAELKGLLSDTLNSLGDIDDSGLVIIDINYGTDFIAIVEMGERRMFVPLLMNDGVFGLENKKIYNWAMFKRVVSTNLEQ